jgi:uncharacterized protein YciI
MFVITLKFADKSKAPEHMAGHKAWIEKYFEAGRFQLVGSLEPNAGGAIIATGGDYTEMENIVREDPFVEHGIVKAEILHISPNKIVQGLEKLT